MIEAGKVGGHALTYHELRILFESLADLGVVQSELGLKKEKCDEKCCQVAGRDPTEEHTQ